MSFGRRIPPPTAELAERERRARELGCVCCLLEEEQGRARAPSYGTKQHCNIGGKHGAPNRGERHTYIGCAWHHLGRIEGYTPREAAQIFGPSFHHQARAFRDRYGVDDDLVALTDRLTGFTG